MYNLKLLLYSGNTKTWPISENIDIIFKEEVVKEGTALTLGVTPIMMSLLKLEGPFIGTYITMV